MRRASFALCCALLTACAGRSDSSSDALVGTETGNPPTRGCTGVTCTPCPPPITLVLTDVAQGGPIRGAVVDDDPEVCVAGEESTICALDGEAYAALGHHELRIEAPGYDSVIVELELEASPLFPCCPCRHSAVRKEISVVPSSR